MRAIKSKIAAPHRARPTTDRLSPRFEYALELVAKSLTADAMQSDVRDGIEHVERHQDAVGLLQVIRTIIAGVQISLAIEPGEQHVTEPRIEYAE